MSDERLLETFLALTRIASPSFREGEVAEYVVAALEEAGCTVTIDASSTTTGSETGNVLAVLPGTGPGSAVALSAHLDTVEPSEGIEPVVADGIVRSAGDTVLGADDKAGVAVILEGVRMLSESGEPHGEVRVILTVAEERGLVGAKALDPDDLRGDLCLVLDADGAPGSIVIGSPTHYTFTAAFHGRAAHAGVQPERGSSAVRMAAQAVATMPHGRIDEETTANVGRIEGGSATNVVPPDALVTGECRSRDPEKVETVRNDMHEAMERAADEAGGRVDITWVKEYDAVRFGPGDPLVTLVEDACRDVGLEPALVTTGGGSDGNILGAKGLPALVLGCGIHDFHTVEEHIAVSDIEDLLRLVLAVLARAGSG